MDKNFFGDLNRINRKMQRDMGISPVKTDSIPMFGGRPVRNTIIEKDDVTNIIILAETTNSVSEFVEAIA